MDEQLQAQIRGEEAEVQFATFEDVERLVSSIPRGPKGDDARVTAELIQEILNVATPIKGVDYTDGVDGTNGKDGKDAPVLTGKDIADMLNALAEAKKLDFSSIRGLNKLDDKVAVLEAARKRNSADHTFYDEKINEILEWIDRIKGLKLMQAGSNRISGDTINWSTTNWSDFFSNFYSNINWADFFNNVDWTQNNWTNFFNAVDWSTFTNWDTFVTSLTTNWTAANWDLFIDTFITNVDSDDVFNFLNQMAGLNKGDMLVYNSVSATWEILAVGADGTVITANSALDQGVEYQANASTPITVQEEGVNVETALTTLNFTGAGATATQTSPGVVQVDIPGGGGGSAEAVVETVTQAAHGLALGKWVYISATNTYAYGLATSSATADTVGVITNVVDPNTFEVTTEGFASGAWVPSYGAGNAAHLSTTVAGDTQQLAPTVVGQIDKPVGVIVEDGVKMYVHNYRGRQITAATSGAFVSVPQQFYSGVSPEDDDDLYEAGMDGDGQNLYLVYDPSASSAKVIEGLVKDPVSGLYRYSTGEVPINTTGAGESYLRIGVGTDYVYILVRRTAGDFTELKRFDKDLTNETLMTGFTGGPTEAYIGMFFYQNKLYCLQNDSVTIDVYTISGTTVALSTSITLSGGGTITGASISQVNGQIWLQRDPGFNGGEFDKHDIVTGAFISVETILSRRHYFGNSTTADGPQILGMPCLDDSNVYEIILGYTLALRDGGSGSTVRTWQNNLEIITYSA